MAVGTAANRSFFASIFLQLYLVFFDGVFCIFSTKEVSRAELILLNSITSFLFLFSQHCCCIQVHWDEGGRVPPHMPDSLYNTGSICWFLTGFFALFQQQKWPDIALCVFYCFLHVCSVCMWEPLLFISGWKSFPSFSNFVSHHILLIFHSWYAYDE